MKIDGHLAYCPSSVPYLRESMDPGIDMPTRLAMLAEAHNHVFNALVDAKDQLAGGAMAQVLADIEPPPQLVHIVIGGVLYVNGHDTQWPVCSFTDGAAALAAKEQLESRWRIAQLHGDSNMDDVQSWSIHIVTCPLGRVP